MIDLQSKHGPYVSLSIYLNSYTYFFGCLLFLPFPNLNRTYLTWILVSYNCFFLPRNKGDLLKINILRQNVVHNSDIGFDSIVHLHIFCIWFTQNCVIICQWQVQSWSFNWNYWFSASRIKKYSLQQRSSSRHIFTNFSNTNLLIFSNIKCYIRNICFEFWFSKALNFFYRAN